ncbi:MAG: dihydroneopterin aldolase [Proteobacteria bacterium]|nr:dihydroneopterin aldolase [Pseudomonadota bacterium]
MHNPFATSTLSSTLVEIHVADFEKALCFYSSLGFQTVRSDESYRVLAKDNNIINLYGGDDRIFNHQYFSSMRAEAAGKGVEIIIFENQIEKLYNEFKQSSHLVENLKMRPWGAKDFRLSDPSGYYLRITEPYENHSIEIKGQKMNYDLMTIEDASFKCKIGLTDAERARQQKIEICTAIEYSIKESALSKDLSKGLCWSDINKFLEKEVQSKDWILVEELIEHLSSSILENFPLIRTIKLKIKKFELINAKWTAIEVYRTR